MSVMTAKQNGRVIRLRADLPEIAELPANVEAEQAILGAILLDNSLCSRAIELLRRDEMFLDSHRRIYDKMISLTERGSPIDLVTLTDELRRAGEFEQVGGATYIASLIDGVPRTDNIDYWVELVAEKAGRRQIMRDASYAFELARDGERPVDEIRDWLRSRQDSIADAHPTRRVLIHAGNLEAIAGTEFLSATHLVAQALNIIFGPSGAFKTFFSTHLSATIAQTGPVAYVAAEGASGFAARIEAWCEHNQTGPGELYFYFDAINLLDSGAVSRFIKLVSATHKTWMLMVFDTLARSLIGGDENSARDIGLAINNCAVIQRELGCAVLLIHHTNRAERGERGSGALRGAADAMIEVSNDDGLITVSCSKIKDSPTWTAERYRFVQFKDSGVLLPAESVAVEYDRLTEQQIRILEALALAVFNEAGATHRQIVEVTRIAESSVYRSLSALKRAGLLTQAAKGDPYRLNDAGRERLSLENTLSRADQIVMLRADNNLDSQLSNSQHTLNTLSDSPHSSTLTLNSYVDKSERVVRERFEREGDYTMDG